MTETITSRCASFESTTNFARDLISSITQGARVSGSATRQVPSQVLYLQPVKKSSLPAGYSTADDFELELIQDDPSFAKKLAAARNVLAKEASGLRGIRLRAGLSQARLAELVGTSQPHIARLERNPSAMMLETALRLSEALSVGIDVIAEVAGLVKSNKK